jgi:RNA polymerase sigma-70 factor (ECF subfamily)
MADPNSPAATGTDPGPTFAWTGLVERIRAAEQGAMEELYQLFSKGVRFYIYRHLGPDDIEDKVHDVFVIITQAIQQGELREPERLMGYVRTIVRRQIAAHIDAAILARRTRLDVDFSTAISDLRPDPERTAIDRQNMELAMRVLQSIPKRDREVLTRFYLNEQAAEQICQDMGLSSNQFRLIKSRAKARFGELGRRRFNLKGAFCA